MYTDSEPFTIMNSHREKQSVKPQCDYFMEMITQRWID